MTPPPDQQFFLLITPVAVITAIASGLAFGWLVRSLRPTADPHLITYLALSLGALWYVAQWAGLFFTEGTGWGTLGRWALYTVCFVPSMWIVLRWRKP